MNVDDRPLLDWYDEPGDQSIIQHRVLVGMNVHPRRLVGSPLESHTVQDTEYEEQSNCDVHWGHG